MLLSFLYPYADHIKILNLFKYITFRFGGALITALLISFLFGDYFITILKKKQAEGQPIRTDGPDTHLLTKKGTPTMGGMLILASLLISTCLWGDLHNLNLWIVIFVTTTFGLIGAYDDYLKLTKRTHHGLSGRYKLLLQTIIAITALWLSYKTTPNDLMNTITIPFTKDYLVHVGLFYIPWAIVVIIGSSNAVNLTDGLDGLAIGPVIIASFCFACICYMVGHIKFAEYLQLHYISHAGELSIFLGALIGSGLGFLWFNAPPARIFMGDTGSLAVGGALGSIGVLIKHEIVLAIIGGLFVLEAVSVIIQVGYYKCTKKRIFLMAPIHHHFEKKGWAEPTIVIRFWIIATILGLVGLSTLKIR